MIFSSNTYSEVPLSSTKYMYLTRNKAGRGIILYVKPVVNIQLKTVEFRQKLGVYSIELNINQEAVL
jgi:hypothetical protein